jgi:hypothetical protein
MKSETADGTQWQVAMRAHDFERAWQINDSDLRKRIAAGAPKHTGPRHLQHIWQGEPLQDRRVLVRCYHGLGDTIQFVRFAKDLSRVAREVIVWAQPELLPLLSDVAGIDRLIPLHDGAPDAEFDVDIEIMELGHALRANAAMVASHVPYLSSRPGTLHPALLRRTATFAVGIVWETGAWDPRRSIPSALLAPLAAVPGVQLYSLRPGAAADHPPFAITDASCGAILDLAATLRELDLIITIDTMTAHLAGAMGLNVWTLLHSDCDWRWGTEVTTPWYPSMRLMRQDTAASWEAPLLRVSSALTHAARQVFAVEHRN